MINKANPRKHLDEMQVQTRNKVGNQCFSIIIYLLMIDLGLGNYGVKWAASPMSIFVIIVICIGYYLTRLVWSGVWADVYVCQSKNTNTIIAGLLATMIITFSRANFFKGGFNISYHEVLEMIIDFFVYIMIIEIFRIISRRKNNEGND